MKLKCPNCQSEDVCPRNLARRIGGTIGALAGATSGAVGVLGAGRIGFVIGTPAGPVVAMLSAAAAMTLRSIVGATIGCEVGTTLGELIDAHILENDACRSCGHTFREATRRSTVLESLQNWRFPGRSPGFTPPEHDDDPDDEDQRLFPRPT